MSVLRDLFTIGLVSAGAFFFLAGTLGLLRFPDTLSRLHALTKADNLGVGLVMLGLLPWVEGLAGGFKLIAIWLLVQISGATIAQVIAAIVTRSGPDEGAPP
jgi:multicomponent Na+:H+ antiporter subunit G